MQITNISRDVNEDLNRGRIYFPTTFLKKNKDFKEIPKKNLNVFLEDFQINF